MTTEEENIDICEKLLGWKRRECFSTYTNKFMGYEFLDGERPTTAPAFTAWADAGLILDALRAKGMTVHIFSERYKFHVEMFDSDSESARINFCEADADKAPLAIRSVALEYIRSLP